MRKKVYLKGYTISSEMMSDPKSFGKAQMKADKALLKSVIKTLQKEKLLCYRIEFERKEVNSQYQIKMMFTAQ